MYGHSKQQTNEITSEKTSTWQKKETYAENMYLF